MNYEVYFLHADKHWILSFWVSVTRHAQSTQNKFAYLCNISIKAWGMKLIFCLQINTKVFYKMIVPLWVCIARQAQSTKNNHLQYLWKTWRMKLIFYLLVNVECFFKLIHHFRCVWPGMYKIPKITRLLYWFFTCR